MRRTSARCSACYEEQRATGQTIHSPLIWRIAAVNACLKHKRKLQDVCPYEGCGNELPALGPRSQVGYCPYCNRWLGTDDNSHDEITEEELQHQSRIVGSVGELLATAPILTEP